MRKVSIVIALCFVLALALTVLGQDSALDPVMKQVGPTWASLGMKIDAGDAPGVAADAAKLQMLMMDTQAFFMKSKMQMPADIAKEIGDAAGTAAKAAKAGTVDKASKAAIGKCKSCHDVYRQKNQDGSFGLKAQ